MLRILYWISIEAHKRVCLSLVEHDDVTQAIVLPTSVSTKNIKLKNIYKYNHPYLDGVVDVINKFKPDIFIQYTSSRYFVKVIKSRNIKYGFSAHGIWPESFNNKNIVADTFFQNFDLFLGGSHIFEHILRTYAKTKAIIATDVLTQFDVLHSNMKKNNEIRNSIIKNSDNPGATKLITLFGHNCTTKTDNLLPYNYGYYRAVIELAELAKKHNWLVFIKPKGGKDRNLIKTTTEKWAKIDGIKERYLKLSNNKNLKFLPYNADAYKYLCSDVVVTSARSTIEVEAALIKKPILRIWLPKPEPNERQLSYEYGALDFNATYLVKDILGLEKIIISAFNNNDELNKNQEKFIKYLGITFDGKAHIRLLDAILKVIGDKK